MVIDYDHLISLSFSDIDITIGAIGGMCALTVLILTALLIAGVCVKKKHKDCKADCKGTFIHGKHDHFSPLTVDFFCNVGSSPFAIAEPLYDLVSVLLLYN